MDFVVSIFLNLCPKEPRFDYLAGLQVYLENKFNRKIEIVRKGIQKANEFYNEIDEF